MPNHIPSQPEDVVLTQDGSSTLYSHRYKDHYHSTFGAIAESQYIFIECGLDYVKTKKREISILEIGFGTGLNAFITCLNSEKYSIAYTTLEPYALADKSINKLNYLKILGNESVFSEIHGCPWNEYIQISEHFRLRKLSTPVQELSGKEEYSLIYFDAFSPTVQPELWTKAIFEGIYRMCADDAVLVTYSSKGAVKRALIESGFRVEKLPGPKGKREIIRAHKSVK